MNCAQTIGNASTYNMKLAVTESALGGGLAPQALL